jgi:hypothetical protein
MDPRGGTRDKARAEEALRKSRLELSAAASRIEAQQAELASLHGRSTALKLASSEGRWSPDEARRFSGALVRDRTFRGEDLRVLLEQAVVASRRRTSAAIEEAQAARVESERTESSGAKSVEGSLQGLEAEERARARAVLVGSNRATIRLRGASLKLESEARASERVHAAEVRAVAARLVAEREALVSAVLCELNVAEAEMASLVESNERLAAGVSERDRDVTRLQRELGFTREALIKQERVGSDLMRESGELRAEAARIAAELNWVQREGDALRRCLTNDLSHADEGLTTASKASAAQAERAELERTALVNKYEARIASMSEQSSGDVELLKERLRKLGLDYHQLERSMHEKMRLTTHKKDKEINHLRFRVERLSQQVLGLKANSSSGRRALYWANVQNGNNRMLEVQADWAADDIDPQQDL